jgi:hypothetical protein
MRYILTLIVLTAVTACSSASTMNGSRRNDSSTIKRQVDCQQNRNCNSGRG